MGRNFMQNFAQGGSPRDSHPKMGKHFHTGQMPSPQTRETAHRPLSFASRKPLHRNILVRD